MADQKVSQLTAITSAASNDEILINDVSDTTDSASGSSRKITVSNLTGGITATPGGSNTQVQFNDSGVFGGDAGMTYNKATDTLSVGVLTPTTDIAVADGGTGASNASGARTNLGLVIGTNVQAWDTDLDTWATKTAPTGTVVGTTDTQTLSGKTFTSPIINVTSDATGDIYYRNGSGAFTRLAIGTARQVLVVNSGATAPSWVSWEGVRVYNSANQSISNSSDTTLTFDSEDYDTASIHNTGSNTSRLTVPSAGKWHVTAAVNFNNGGSTTGRRLLFIMVNGAAINGGQIEQGPTSGATNMTLFYTSVLNLSANDYIELAVNQSSGGSMNVVGGNTGARTVFECYRVD